MTAGTGKGSHSIIAQMLVIGPDLRSISCKPRFSQIRGTGNPFPLLPICEIEQYTKYLLSHLEENPPSPFACFDQITATIPSHQHFFWELSPLYHTKKRRAFSGGVRGLSQAFDLSTTCGDNSVRGLPLKHLPRPHFRLKLHLQMRGLFVFAGYLIRIL